MKVLIINDCKLEKAILSDMLTVLGYHVRLSDENKAWDDLLDFKPDIVVVNYIMKRITGDELAAVIKKQRPKVKCYISSCSDLRIDDFNYIDGLIKTPVKKENLRVALSQTSHQ